MIKCAFFFLKMGEIDHIQIVGEYKYQTSDGSFVLCDPIRAYKLSE